MTQFAVGLATDAYRRPPAACSVPLGRDRHDPRHFTNRIGFRILYTRFAYSETAKAARRTGWAKRRAMLTASRRACSAAGADCLARRHHGDGDVRRDNGTNTT